MRTQRFALERRGPKRLEVRWPRGRGAEILLDGALAGAVGPDALAIGGRLALPDGSRLTVRRVARRWWSVAFRDEVLLERGGAPVPGSDGDPRTIGRRAGRLLLLYGFAVAVLTLLFRIFSRPGTHLGGGHEGPALLLFGVLALLGQRWPILLGAVLILADSALALAQDGLASPVGLLVRGLVAFHLVQAWQRTAPPPER